MKFAHIRPSFFSLIVLLIVASTVLAACGTPAASPAATDAPIATDAPTQPPQSNSSDILFEEDFADNSNNWEIGSNENSQSVIENGKLTIKSQPIDPILYTFLTLPVSADEVDISVDTEFTEGAPTNINYGIACQFKDEDNYLWIAIRPDGYYGISRKVNAEWENLASWTASGLIRQGTDTVNRLRAVCSEGHVTLFINDTLAADVVTPSLSGGTVRLWVSSFPRNIDDNSPVGMSFSNLVVRRPLAWEPPTGILFSDSFTNNDNAWKLSEDDDASVKVQDGQMVIGIKKEDYWKWVQPQVQVSNVDISFDAVLQEGTPSNAAFGAICHYQDNDNFIQFRISNDSYRLSKKVNGTWSTLIDWTYSSAIEPGTGKTNRIRVVCSDSDLELYVNDQLLIAQQDTSFTTGGSALFAGRNKVDDALVSVALDNLEVKYPLEHPSGVLLADSFDNNDNAWDLFEDENASAQILDGIMVIKVGTTDIYRVRSQVSASNVDMSFHVSMGEGTPSNAYYGVMCRFVDWDNYYQFSISENYYMVEKMVNGTRETLVDWTTSTSLSSGLGEFNLIRVVCSDSSLELYANDQRLITLQDTSLTAGTFALFAGRWDTDNTPISVGFDNLEVKFP